MGHVDHGKTSILDKIRDTQIQAGEAGGITQSTGAYQAEVDGELITFIDTPGHEAFSRMRARGGQAADIVVLVVAADDGIMPQTEEAISHIQASNAKMIIALNKVDLPAANVNKVKGQFDKHDIKIKEYGGDVPVVETSAETGDGIDDLLLEILATAESCDLEVEDTPTAEAMVIESYVDDRRGPIINAIVMKGSMSVRDSFIVGLTSGRIKALSDWKGNSIKEAGPATPVEILGANESPEAGTVLEVVKKLKDAQKIAAKRLAKDGAPQEISAADRIRQAFFQQNVTEIPLIVKAESQGSLEALVESIEKLSNDDVTLKILHSGVGVVSESDVLLAVPVRAIVIGFNVGVDKTARQVARRERIVVRTYEIIYHLLEELGEVVQGEVDSLAIEILGEATVLKVFELSDGSLVTGSNVTDGELKKGNKVRVLRDDEVVLEGTITSLRQGKESVNIISEGNECGIMINGGQSHEVQEGDTVQAIA